MSHPPRRRQLDPMAAAEAVFKPKKTETQPVVLTRTAPTARELVSLRLDRAVLEHFQEDGPGWQDRINDTLRKAVAAMKGE